MKFRPFYTVIFGNIERNIREYHNNVEEQTEQRIPFNAYFIWNKKQMNIVTFYNWVCNILKLETKNNWKSKLWQASCFISHYNKNKYIQKYKMNQEYKKVLKK